MSIRLVDLPPLDLVRSFVCVARRMSITLAAEELCVTQSAVSRQIRVLEEHLGCALFVRGHRSIELTAEGEHLFRVADGWLDRMGEAVEALKPSATEAVSVTSAIGIMSLWLLPRIGAFQTAHPRIDLRLLASPRMVDLERENVDLAIRYLPEAGPPRLPTAIRLFEEQLVPVAHPSLDAANATLLEFDDPSHPQLSWSHWFRHSTKKAARKLESGRLLRFNQYDQLVHAALAGHGIALGRLPLIDSFLRDGRLTMASRAAPISVSYGYWLLARSRPVSRSAGVVKAWILDEAAKAMASGRP